MENIFPLALKKTNQETLFQIDEISERSMDFTKFKRGKYFSIFWIKQGKGSCRVNSGEFEFNSNCILSFIPEQTFVFLSKENLTGTCMHIHSDFFPVKKTGGELGLEMLLLNNSFASFNLHLPGTLISEFEYLERRIIYEMRSDGIAQFDLLLSYLKIFLLNAAREKVLQAGKEEVMSAKMTEPLFGLQYQIELSFRKSHSPAYYAKLLNKTPKNLNNIVKKSCNKTLTRIIQDRVIVEAKRELMQSDKSIKAIGIDLGFNDVFYFSRFFKKMTGISPENYRHSSGSC